MTGNELDARIDKASLRKALDNRIVGSRFLYFLTLTSTNEHGRELAEDGWPEGTVVLAEEQTAGKGRAGRSWHSPPGLGLYVSIILKPSLAPEKVPLMTLMTAVATARALRDGGHDAVLKWPNDILLGGLKVGGILADARIRPGGPTDVVVGLGLNVNHRQEDWPADLLPRAGSLRMIGGRILDRTEILGRVLIRIDEAYAAMKAGSDASLIDDFLSLCPMARGRTISVVGDGAPIAGESAGLSPAGALRVITPDGVKEIHGGEISIAETDDAARG